MLSCDVEINLDPLSNCKEHFSIFYRNLNSLSAHDYSKLFLLKAYIILHKERTKKEDPKNTVNEFNKLFKKKKSKTKVYLKNTFGF